ncbi:hypothetical protein QZH41_005963 [Actinostola sp. cb2023]|nr:hypothetical protein QZH41_005963 [Actinostola sp. cb2023]
MGAAKHNPLKLEPQEAKQYIKNNNLIKISNCHFTRNRAPTPEFAISEIPSLPFSRGAGLAISISGNSSSNRVFIDFSSFIENEAVWGGGLQIQLEKRTQNNTITISNTRFKYNYARAEGGGLRLASIVEEDITLLPNYFNLISCQITENKATWGGGLTTYGATFLTLPNRFIKYQHSEIIFKSCNITDNKGTIGAAIGAFLVNRNEDEIGPGVPYNLIFDSCIISHNNVIIREPSYVVGQGAVYSDEVPLIFKNNVTIFSNDGTAVVLDSATMMVYDCVNFTYNSGFRGGALALYGDSKVTLMKNSHLYFYENHCNEKGGAVYVSAPGPPLVSFNSNGIKIHKCFLSYEKEDIDYNDWKTEIVFQGNSVGDASFAANSSGRSVFASTLRDCRRIGETRENNTALEWDFIKYKDKNGTAVGIKGEVVTEPIDIIYNETEWKVAPSQVFKVSLSLIDEKDNNVYGIVQISVKGNSKFVIGLANIQIKTGGSCLMTNITDADKLMLMYLLPTYILVSVFILAKVVRKWPNWCYSRRVKSPFRALCTLFVLCYTNITSISLKILYPAYIGDRTVMFMDGEMDFFKGRHIAYAIIAIIYLVLVVIPCPLILMFTPFFTKILRPIVNVNTLKPYYDAFQGCFKDHYRWCSAFYFVCRLYLLLVSTYMPSGPWKRALLEDSCMVMLAVFVYLKPYKEEYTWLNLLDAVLLCNLGIMTIFSTALQNAQSYSTSYHDQFEAFIKVLSYVPLCYLIFLMIYLAIQYREYLKQYMILKMKLRADSTIMDNYSETDTEGNFNQENEPRNLLTVPYETINNRLTTF